MRRLHRFATFAATPLLCGCVGSLGTGIAYPGQGVAYQTRDPANIGYGAPAYHAFDGREDRGLSDWYRGHPVERQAQLAQCEQDPGTAQDRRCLAAIQADRQEASFQRAQAQFGDTAYGAPVLLGPIVTPQIK